MGIHNVTPKITHSSDWNMKNVLGVFQRLLPGNLIRYSAVQQKEALPACQNE
jgi:hypothetical protein